MNEQPARPTILDLLSLREGEEVVNVTAYRVEYRKIPKWQFWRTELVKVNLAVLTNAGRFFIVDPDNITVEEKPNNY